MAKEFIMKIGNLVRIRAYCKHGGNLAIVVEAPNCIKCVKIVLTKSGERISSLSSNLEVISCQ